MHTGIRMITRRCAVQNGIEMLWNDGPNDRIANVLNASRISPKQSLFRFTCVVFVAMYING
jgi:hypothetical protein